MFNEICNKHVPFKKTKICSKSDPWITNEIGRTMNYRYKLFKSAVRTKDVTAWAKYKNVRNEITAQDVCESKLFRENTDSAKSTAAYLKVLFEATNPKRRPQIGPIRREYNTLAVRDKQT